METRVPRRLPIGSEPLVSGGSHFRVWAPLCQAVAVVLEDSDASDTFPLEAEKEGYFSGVVVAAGPGSRYRYQLDGGGRFPDPASRFQPEGPEGPSEVIDPTRYEWRDDGWGGIRRERQVIYEMHVGTFTLEGTWSAALRQLPALAELGITVIELMPVADFAGRRGWGYDGVNLFAPTRLYGTPDDLRRFVDEAHHHGVGVILDVVYNHFGPSGNYIAQFSDCYTTAKYEGEWGDCINFDGPSSDPVRAFFVANAGYWIREFHLDGLRLDATQSINDTSPVHILSEITRAAREAAGERSIFLVGENEPQHVKLVRSYGEGGYGLDALWNDDFHHSAMVALTGQSEAYYSDYLGTPQELVSAIKYGYLYQGQWYTWQKKRRGTPAFGVPHATWVTFLQNHDQVANSAAGLRVNRLASPGRYRALTALMLLGPGTPMLFQGQEFAASSPFLYFVDHEPSLSKLVSAGRKTFLSQFPGLALPEIQKRLPEPGDLSTFERCKLDLGERERHAEAYALHRDLLALRRDDPVIASQAAGGVDGAVLGTSVFALRLFGLKGDDRLLLCNLGTDLSLRPMPEPLMAPPEGRRWRLIWSSEDPRYGGTGTLEQDVGATWQIAGEAFVVLGTRPVEGEEHA